MRDALINLFKYQITLEDDSIFYYSIKPYEFTNMLGNLIAILREYHFIRSGDNDKEFSCKLYKTDDGNWYDIEEVETPAESKILRMLKYAVDRDTMTLEHVGQRHC